MVIKYTLSEFRKNLRIAFNEADNGREVYIERYGQRYRLSSLVGKPMAPVVSPEDHDKAQSKAIRGDEAAAIVMGVMPEPTLRLDASRGTAVATQIPKAKKSEYKFPPSTASKL